MCFGENCPKPEPWLTLVCQCVVEYFSSFMFSTIVQILSYTYFFYNVTFNINNLSHRVKDMCDNVSSVCLTHTWHLTLKGTLPPIFPSAQAACMRERSTLGCATSTSGGSASPWHKRRALTTATSWAATAGWVTIGEFDLARTRRAKVAGQCNKRIPRHLLALLANVIVSGLAEAALCFPRAWPVVVKNILYGRPNGVDRNVKCRRLM